MHSLVLHTGGRNEIKYHAKPNGYNFAFFERKKPLVTYILTHIVNGRPSSFLSLRKKLKKWHFKLVSPNVLYSQFIAHGFFFREASWVHNDLAYRHRAAELHVLSVGVWPVNHLRARRSVWQEKPIERLSVAKSWCELLTNNYSRWLPGPSSCQFV